MEDVPVARAAGPEPPGPTGLQAVRWMGNLRRDALQTLAALRHRYGDVARLPLPTREKLVLVAHPDGVQHVLQAAHPRYRKARSYELLAMLLGEGLLTSEGDHWRAHRRLAQPAFHGSAVEGFGTMMVKATTATVSGWRHGDELDLAAAMRDLTLQIVGRALFSENLTGEAERIGEGLDVALDYARGRFQSLLGPHVTPPTPARARFRRAVDDLDEVVRDIIRRRRDGAPRDDLLGLLMASEDDATGQRLDDTELRDEVLTFLLAGHETTAHALAWTWWLLGRHTAPLRRLQAELADVLGDRPVTVGDLPELAYLRAVVEEGMRLYPPAWVVQRTPIEPDTVGGCVIRPGTVVMISQWITHRHPDVWRRPLAFEPERFLDERAGARHRFAHFPFGAGPRQCIGAGFAMIEAQLILATMAQRLELDPVPGFPVEPEPGITLRPERGIRVVVRRRGPAPITAPAAD